MELKTILVIAIFIFYIFYNSTSNERNSLIHKTVTTIMECVVICLILNSMIYAIIEFRTQYELIRKNNEIFEISDEKIKQEKLYLEKLEIEIPELDNFKKPYIPIDFKYVEGEYDNGFVIEDNGGNQYVWIPCSNIRDNDTRLIKKNFEKKTNDGFSFVSCMECYDNNYEKFMESTLQNGGYYISRFEIGIENNKPVSKINTEVWSNVTRNEAIEIVKGIQYKDVECNLINGYAYDTVIQWLTNSKGFDEDFTDITDCILSGRKQYNRIYDITDNILEITDETFYDTVIIRGFLYRDHILYKNRINILETENYFVDSISKVGFRTIIYK